MRSSSAVGGQSGASSFAQAFTEAVGGQADENKDGIVSAVIALSLFQSYTRDQSLRELKREAVGLTQLYAAQALQSNEQGSRAPSLVGAQLELRHEQVAHVRRHGLVDLEAHGVEIVGHIDSGLPSFGLPELSLPASLSPERMADRRQMLDLLDRQSHLLELSAAAQGQDQTYQKAVSLDPSLQSSKDALKRLGAKRIFYDGRHDDRLLDVLAEQLRAGYPKADAANGDAVAWMVRALAISRKEKYKPLVEQVLAEATVPTVQTHARRALDSYTQR
jgi:hypothetical protein